MSELPRVGLAITIVDPGPSTNAVWVKRQDGRPSTPRKKPAARTVLRAYVIHVGPPMADDDLGAQIVWACGRREGSTFQNDEGRHWVRGHGPQARGSLLAARALEHRR